MNILGRVLMACPILHCYEETPLQSNCVFLSNFALMFRQTVTHLMRGWWVMNQAGKCVHTFLRYRVIQKSRKIFELVELV